MNISITASRSLVVAGIVGCAAIAQAVVISESARVGPVPSLAGTGLNGSFWDTLEPGWHGVGWDPQSIAAADAFVASLPKTATFSATYLDYPNGTKATTSNPEPSLSVFLGSDGVTLSGGGSTSIEWSSTYLFQGYIKITSDLDVTPGGTIDVNFGLGSDDGSRLKIGGVQVAARDGLTVCGRGWCHVGKAAAKCAATEPDNPRQRSFRMNENLRHACGCAVLAGSTGDFAGREFQ